jgi:hypothetical protein
MEEIETRSKQNGLPKRGGFLTFEFIDGLFTIENIAEQFRQHQDSLPLPRKERYLLAQSIKKDQQKLYAILLLMDKSDRLTSSKARAYTDKFLFPTAQPGHASLPCPSSKLEKLKNSALFHGIASAFYEKQFVFPPSLSTTTTETYPLCFTFPFASQRDLIGHGSYGDVFKVEIPNGFLQSNQRGKAPQVIGVSSTSR